MSINWIEAYYWQSREQNPVSTPGQKAPLVKSDSSSFAQSSTEQGPVSVQKRTPEQQRLILQSLRNYQHVNVTGDTGMYVTTEDQTENP